MAPPVATAPGDPFTPPPSAPAPSTPPPAAPAVRVEAARDARSQRAAQDLLLRLAEELGAAGLPLDVREEAIWIGESHAPPEGGLWVAWSGADPVGFAALAPHPEGPPEAAEVRRLYVLPQARGGAVGVALARAALDAARAAGYAELLVDALPGMEPLYRRFGFADVGHVPGRPGLRMRRRL